MDVLMQSQALACHDVKRVSRQVRAKKRGDWPGSCIEIPPFCSGRESERITNRFALAMGEVVHRTDWFFPHYACSRADRLALTMGEVVQHAGRLFLLNFFQSRRSLYETTG
jgi:hypothetical protein